VGAQAFPVGAQYVALGHLHRAQDIPGPTRIHYSGSPLQLDFGEDRDTKSVAVVEVAPGLPAAVRDVPLTTGRALRTLRGSLAELEAAAGSTGDAHLRVVVTDTRRAGMADLVRGWFPDCVDVVVRAPDEEAPVRGDTAVAGRDPGELFRAYLDTTDLDDPRVPGAFDQLLEEVTA
jgi:exonuclease SbcD